MYQRLCDGVVMETLLIRDVIEEEFKKAHLTLRLKNVICGSVDQSCDGDGGAISAKKIRHHYRCYSALQVSQRLANLAPVEPGFSASIFLPLSRLLDRDPQTAPPSFPRRVAVSDRIGSIWESKTAQ